MKMRSGVVRTFAAILLGTGLGVPDARASAFVWPTSGVISGTFYSTSRLTGGRHGAVDISNAYGTPIYAARHGNYWQGYNAGGYGIYAKVDHDAGYRTVYAHLSRYNGGRRTVRQGDLIAFMGHTGAANGVNHLHWEVQRWGVKQFVPATYLQRVTANTGIGWNFPGL